MISIWVTCMYWQFDAYWGIFILNLFYGQYNVLDVCYYPLILRSVLTLTGRLNCTMLSRDVPAESWFELLTERLISKEETSSRKLTVGCSKILNETWKVDWLVEIDSCLREIGCVYMKIFTLLLPAIGLPRSHFKTCSFLWDGGEHSTGGEVPLAEDTSSNSVLM